MKRYKLKKDLPTFQAGDEFYLDSNNDLRLKGSDIMAYNHKTLEKFSNIIKNWFEEIPDDKRWRAEKGEGYWYVNDCGAIKHYHDYRDVVDNFRFTTGNYFKTKKEAEAYKEYLIARQVLLDDAEGGKFIPYKMNYCLLNNLSGDWLLDWTYSYEQGRIYFKDRESLKKSLKEHEEQWEIVRKYKMGEM